MRFNFFLLAMVMAARLTAAPSIIDESKLVADSSELAIYDLNYSRRFIPYIKISPEITNLGKHNTLMPGLGFGFRSESNTSAVDCSFSGAFLETKDNQEIYHYFTPKLLYLKYLNSHSPSAIFLGFGSAWAGIRDEVSKQSFDGLAGVVSIGIERNRSSRIRQIFQLDVNQPVLALKAGGPLPFPIIGTSFSLGF